VAKALEFKGHSYEYESTKVPYVKPATGCTYLIDFVLNNGIAIEVKGQFTSDDRKKHLLIKDQWPDLDLRFVFSNPHQKLSKKSKTSYAKWCEKHGFRWAQGSVPDEWMNEPKNRRSIKSIKKIKNSQIHKGGRIYVPEDTEGNDS